MRAGGSCCALYALWALRAGFALRARGSCCAGGAGLPLYPLNTLDTLRALRPRFTLRSLRTGCSCGAGGARCSRQALRALWTLRTLRAGCAYRSHRSHRALRAGRSLRAHRAARAAGRIAAALRYLSETIHGIYLQNFMYEAFCFILCKNLGRRYDEKIRPFGRIVIRFRLFFRQIPTDFFGDFCHHRQKREHDHCHSALQQVERNAGCSRFEFPFEKEGIC